MKLMGRLIVELVYIHVKIVQEGIINVQVVKILVIDRQIVLVQMDILIMEIFAKVVRFNAKLAIKIKFVLLVMILILL